MEEIIKLLREKQETIATMESCTGGGVANAITNVEGASDVFKFSAITYSTEFKIKMGVSKEVVEKYSVYSMETANEMSKNISLFANSDYGIGITGKLLKEDKNNSFGEDNVAYVSIYCKKKDNYKNAIIKVDKQTRKENKKVIIEKIKELLKEVLS